MHPETSVQITRVGRGASGIFRPKHRPRLHLVRVTTKGGKFLRLISQKEAWRMVDAKSAIEGPTRKATGNEKRPRLISIKDVRAGVDQQIPIGTLVTTYTEDLGDTRFVITSKRVQPDGGRGSLVKYDPDLTFAELREGRFVSATTVERRAVARAERSFLGH